MKTNVNRNVEIEIDKMHDSIKALVIENIKALKEAQSLSDLKNVKPMEGTKKPFYRLTIGTYKLLLHYEKDTKTVTVHALTHRKDTYKKENLPWRR
jgi:mRNA-degrading endonuclease RelE of RelBE toxin-antitoxin system